MKILQQPAAAVIAAMVREVVPLSKRPVDVVYFGFYLINLFLITYCVDVEQSKHSCSSAIFSSSSRRTLSSSICLLRNTPLRLAVTHPTDPDTLLGPNGEESYPWWPPAPAVDVIRWYGRNFDPVLIARPAFWRMTIWIDSLFFGPFYIAAMYCLWHGHEWIREVSLLWSGSLIAIVCIILHEEFLGVHAATSKGSEIMVLLLNLPWLLFPAFNAGRMIA